MNMACGAVGTVLQVDVPAQRRAGQPTVLGVGCGAGQVQEVTHRPGGAGPRAGDDRHRGCVARANRDRSDVGQCAAVGDPHRDIQVGRRGVGRRGDRPRGQGLEGSVAVEVPFVGEPGAERVGRRRGVEADAQRHRPGADVGDDLRVRRGHTSTGRDAVHGAEHDVDEVQVATRTGLEIDGSVDLQHLDDLARVGYTAWSGLRCPQAVAGVVGEEQCSMVLGRIAEAFVEGEAGDAALQVGRTGAWCRPGRVRIRDERRGGRVGGVAVEVFADGEIEAVEGALSVGPLVTRPSEVVRRCGIRVGGVDARRGVLNPVDLLEPVPADIGDVGVVGARPECEPERIAQAEADDPSGIGVGVGAQWVVGEAGRGDGVDSYDRAFQADRIGQCAKILGPQHAALGPGEGRARAGGGVRISASIRRPVAPRLPIVGAVGPRRLAVGQIEAAVGGKLEVADGVRSVRLAVVPEDERLVRADVRRSVVAQDLARPETLSVDLTGRIVGAVVERVAGVPPHRSRRSERAVIGEGDVEERGGGPVGMELEGQ